MKKLIFLFTFCFAIISLMAQTSHLTISGTVTDTATGNPVPNYPVHIDIDSASGGFFYHHEVHTMQNGYYVDTVDFNAGNIPSGTVVVSTMDCQQIFHYGIFTFNNENQDIAG